MSKYGRGYQESKRRFVQAVKRTVGCVDCGRVEPIEMLDFDHRDPGTKSFEINDAVRGEVKISFADMAAEMAKCDVRCRWCHTRRHITEDPGLVSRAGFACWGIPRPHRRRLDAGQVTEIRQRYAQGGASHRSLGAEYGVAPGTIANYLEGRHVSTSGERRGWLYRDGVRTALRGADDGPLR